MLMLLPSCAEAQTVVLDGFALLQAEVLLLVERGYIPCCQAGRRLASFAAGCSVLCLTSSVHLLLVI